MLEESAPPDALRVRAKSFRRALTVAFWLVLMLLVLERLGYAGAYQRDGFAPGRALDELILSLPVLINLAALWELRRAAAEIARGNLFGAVVVSALRRVGALLAAAAVATILVMPLVSGWLGETEQRLINADVATLIVAGIGIGQILVAALIERAGLAQRELEEFF